MRNKSTIHLCYAGLIALLVFVFSSIAPTVSSAGSPASSYPFLKKQSNKIQNSRAGMDNFFEKLRLLKLQDSERITILHVGDSHIQPDMMTGVIRESLQAAFGNAGRGLIFPYSLAKTNGPGDLKTTSNTTWRGQRSAWPTGDMPTGISGFAIGTSNSNATISIGFRESANTRNLFNKVTVYHDKGPEAFEFRVVDEAPDIYDDTASSAESAPYTTTFILPAPTSHMQLAVKKARAVQKHAILYGISLENGKRGILYHMAGVNGASFKTFNESAYFIFHMNTLKPDLIIISLGTNDVGDSNFDPPSLRAQIDGLVKSISKDNPDISILFTLPPDFGKARNTLIKQKMLKARGVIIDYCKSNKLAYWDLYEVMGGHGSIEQWQKSSLAQKDVMHFTRAGYELQGHLLFQALSDGLRDYESNRLK